MNNSYYQNPIYSNTIPNNRYDTITMEDNSYIDDTIKKYTGKPVQIHITVPGSIEWQDKTFEGIIENVGKDNILISNNKTNEKNIIPLIYITFITLLNRLNY